MKSNWVAPSSISRAFNLVEYKDNFIVVLVYSGGLCV